MHTLLTLLSILFVVVACYLAFGILHRLEGWTSRRDLQFWVLVVPLISLILCIGALLHFVYRDCLLSAPTWDHLLALVLPVSMGLIACGGVVLGVVRLTLISWFVVRHGSRVTPELQALADIQAEKLGLSHPRLLLRVHDRPLALTCGLWQPTLLLSTWMIEQLDRRELEAVLAHELAHVVRYDFLAIWLATMLRDAFFYLPTSRMAYSQLQCEKELACDDVAVGLTNRPLALASALAKVWQELVSVPTFGIAQSLVERGDLIETRIERLMAVTKPIVSKSESRVSSLKITALSLVSLVVVEVMTATVILGLMGCGPMMAIFSKFMG